MSRCIRRVRRGDHIDLDGKRWKVTEVYPYFVRMIEPELKIMNTANLGQLVIMGLEDQHPTDSTADAFRRYLGKY